MPRKLIICTDGTWNKVDKLEKGQYTSTNVSKLAAALVRDDEQIVYYLEGVGAPDDESIIGGAFGWGLSGNILQAYTFLCRTYRPGDLIYIFGFSRGAFTARSLAAMLHNCGILRQEASATVHDALLLYRSRIEADRADSIRSRVFRAVNAHEVQVECLGVWDTVGSLGIPGGKWVGQMAKWLDVGWDFHNAELGPHVRHAYHALAIHERRSTFEPTWWKATTDELRAVLVQRWFPGVHSDIGGGYGDAKDAKGENDESGLSNRALEWMVSMLDGKTERTDGKQLPAGSALRFREGWQTAVKGVPQLRKAHDSYGAMWRFLDRHIFKKPRGYIRLPKPTNGSTDDFQEEVDPTFADYSKKFPAEGQVFKDAETQFLSLLQKKPARGTPVAEVQKME